MLYYTKIINSLTKKPLTFSVKYSNVIYSKIRGFVFMSSIDLAILGMVSEREQSAYDIQRDVEYHNFNKWTKISISSVYKKVLFLKEQGYLTSRTQKGEKFADKEIYSITDKGREYFLSLMDKYASESIAIPLGLNLVISNLNKVPLTQAQDYIKKIRTSLIAAQKANDDCIRKYLEIPLVGRTITEQQRVLYQSLLDWLNDFERQYGNDQSDRPI